MRISDWSSDVCSSDLRDSLRAEKILQQRLFAHPKIKVVWDHAIDEIVGAGDPKGVTGVKLRNTKTGAVDAAVLSTDGVFIAIGHTPNTELFKGQLPLDAEGYITTRPGTTQTTVAGVFAAGDVQDKTR